jgi:drug/metabolite transporter (DMT)-like permease
MSADLMVNSLVLVSLLLWGAWGIFDKKALGYTQPVGQLAAVYSFSPLMAVFMVAVLSMFLPGWKLSGHTLGYEFLAQLCYFVAVAAYLIAMSRGEASLILGATASYPVVAQVLAKFMLGEPLVPARIIGCLVVVAGIVAISGSSLPLGKIWKKRLPAPASASDAWGDAVTATAPATATAPVTATTPATATATLVRPTATATAFAASTTTIDQRGTAVNVLITVVCIGLAVLGWALRGIFDKTAVTHAHPFEVYLGKYVADSVFGALAIGWVLHKRRGDKLFRREMWPYAGGSALCLAGGSAAYYVVLSMTSASYVIAITGCYPLIMYVLALCILKEKFNITRAFGIALITLGGILTQTTQGS